MLLSKISTSYQKLLCHFEGATSVAEELPSVHKLASFLETCTDIEFLRRIHARIFTFGLGSSIFLGSKLVNCYTRFDELSKSKWVFNNIINRNISLWTSIIVGYFRAGHFTEVLHLYLIIKRRGIGIGSSSLNFSLKCCTELGFEELGRQIHADTFKVNLNDDGFVGSSLIGFYSKSRHIEDAKRVFEEIPKKDIVVYTTFITGYAQMPYCHACEAFRIASYMQKEGFIPNRVTLVSLLQAAGQMKGLVQGRSIHAYAIRRGMGHLDEVLETSLIGMYIKSEDLISAELIFGQSKTENLASWNSMICGLVQYGRAFEGVKLFALLTREGIKPDSISIANALIGCAYLKCLHWGTSIHSYVIRQENLLDVIATTALIDVYMRCDRRKMAEYLFDRITRRDVILYNVIVAGFLSSGLPDKAFEMSCVMLEEGIKPNTATILNILGACGDLGDSRNGRTVHAYIIRCGFDLDVEVSNQILHMYTKFGRLDLARQVFNRINWKDLVSWTSMIMGYVNHGHADEAITLFFLMQEARVGLDSVTILGLLQAFSHLGCLKQTKEVHGYVQRNHLEGETSIINSMMITYSKCGRLDVSKLLFDSLGSKCLTSWNTIIAAYGMHGECIGALQHFREMQLQNIKPDEQTFSSVLSVCSHTGLVELGLLIFQSMKAEHQITPREEHYSCIIDLFGRAGRLEEAHDLVKCSPFGQSISALSALVAACRVHRNTELGEVIGRKLLQLEPLNSGAYALVASIYVDAGKWSEVENIWKMAKERGLRKIPGCSMLQSNKPVCGMLFF
ncbi:pentatricopeptide repeat-containing protein At5g39350-like [Aristolochia californica]|uniref:pentatricopeptide repeat-containing protein At5g39350-like n=1 Tax=Aristolochia californica TaxID=171875 RepID=UPI0035E0FDF5